MQVVLHCKHCLEQLPSDLSPQEWNRTEAVLHIPDDEDKDVGTVDIDCVRCGQRVVSLPVLIIEPLRKMSCARCGRHTNGEPPCTH